MIAPERVLVSGKPKNLKPFKIHAHKDAVLQRVESRPLDAAVRLLGDAVAEELGRIFEMARNYEHQLQQTIAESCLLSRDEAALHLNASVSQVDRWADSGELEVVTLDRRPRFALAELNRFVVLHAGTKKRRAKRPRGQKPT
jgi:hypothetical protein